MKEPLLTKAEIATEKQYRRVERLALLCEARLPTPAQMDLVAKEADDWEARYKQENGL